VVRLLLASGADASDGNNAGGTPLVAAAEKGHEAVAALLIEHGADASEKDRDGGTPLLHAALCGQVISSQERLTRSTVISTYA